MLEIYAKALPRLLENYARTTFQLVQKGNVVVMYWAPLLAAK